jgi:hypothetical protein
MRWVRALFLLSCAATVFGQVTTEQKLADFEYTAGIFAKRYGPYEWKRDVVKFDLLDLGPWLDRVRATRDDLEYFDVASEYVSKLNDAHSVFNLPSNFVARLNFAVDIYDGRLLVDSINRARLPAAEYPFIVGYELLSIDGEDASAILERYMRFNVAANPRSTRRLAAQMITTRPQQIVPNAPDAPEVSTVVFRRPDGTTEEHRIPWDKSGLPLTGVGRRFTPTPVADRVSSRQHAAEEVEAEEAPTYMKALERLQNCTVPHRAVLNFGAVTPVFVRALPANFVQRLPKTPADTFFSGSFEANGSKIGFIRIPNYSPPDQTAAIAAFRQEIAWFQENTDGLIVDQMRNPGGSVAYTNTLLSFLMISVWRSIPFEVRATSDWVVAISSALEQAKAQRAPQSIIDLYESIKGEIIAANRANRGRTRPISLDASIDRGPAIDSTGAAISYKKPVMILSDELSASGADCFAATIQDNGRGPLFGWRTMGAGGNVEGWTAGSYTEGVVAVTESLMVRKDSRVTGAFPYSPYIENVGVHPDIEVDYMTRENLMDNGKPYVDAMIAAMVDHIRRSR